MLKLIAPACACLALLFVGCSSETEVDTPVDTPLTDSADDADDTGAEDTGDTGAEDTGDTGADDADDTGSDDTGSDDTDAQACPDADNDGVCDVDDLCAGFDDGKDDDSDGVPDDCDRCPGADDAEDDDEDGRPDGCDCDAPGNCNLHASCAEDGLDPAAGGQDPSEATYDLVVCECLGGYQGDGVVCDDVDECASGNGGCDALTVCNNSDGSHSCSACPGGYTGTGASGCADINECDAANGGCAGTCSNSAGSYLCACAAGFVLGSDGMACDDINECDAANGGCAGTCSNTAGSYACACAAGFVLGSDGMACDDINECEAANGGCAGTCSNTAGSYMCACAAGFALGSDGMACDDINECEAANGGCAGTCANTAGSYACACAAGFVLGSDGMACDDINECEAANGGCAGTCSNTAGSYSCACAAGFVLGSDGMACEDTNECLTDNGGCDPITLCTNTEGGRTCGACPDSFEGTGATACTPVAQPTLDVGQSSVGGATPAQHQAVRDAWQPTLPPDSNTLVPQPGVEVTTTAQASDVRVTPEQLTYKLSEHPEVLEWQPGRVLASGPAEPGSSGRNPFGFIRKVTSVSTVGDDIVVATTAAALEEIFTGELQVEFDPSTARNLELDEFDHQWAVDNLYVDVGLIGEGIEPGLRDDAPLMVPAGPQPVSGDPWGWPSWVKKSVQAVGNAASAVGKAIAKTAVAVYKKVVPASFERSGTFDHEVGRAFTAPMFEFEYAKGFNEDGNFPFEAKFAGSGSVSGSYAYNPKMSFGMRVPNPLRSDAPKFKMWIDLDAYFKANIDVDLNLSASVASAAGKSEPELSELLMANLEAREKILSEFRTALEGDADVKPAGGWKKVLWIGKPQIKIYVVGGVPIVITRTLQLDLECGFELKVELKAKGKLNASSTFKLRAERESGMPAKITGPNFNYTMSRSFEVTGGGSAVVTCGLIPRINVLAYDSVGLNAGVRASAVVKATYETSCEGQPSWQPKGTVGVGLFANFGVQFGGRTQTPGSSFQGKEGLKAGSDLGPTEVWNKEYEVYAGSWNVPGVGYCLPACSMPQGDAGISCGAKCANQCAAGLTCALNSDCKKGLYCVSNVCSDDHCGDGVLTGTETDVDCGGPKCGKCGVDKDCSSANDCTSNACKLPAAYGSKTHFGKCVADLCLDNRKTGSECGIDCGGSCTKCALGTQCGVSADCATNVSNGYTCVATQCGNLMIDAGETDLDCGGPGGCSRCGSGRKCLMDSDCSAAAPQCNPTSKVCMKATCANGTLDADEGDVDCGGPCPAKCAASSACKTNGDCASGLLCRGDTRVCAPPSCDDNVKSPTEGDVDCGVQCPTTCAVGKTCNLSRDCASGICVAGICAATGCFDRARNGTETDVDCGGTCSVKCTTGQACTASADCASLNCVGGTCAATSCSDNLTNGGESDLDCGGVCNSCDVGKSCGIGGDCASRICDATQHCQGPTCSDAFKNGSETDADCGGSCPLDCDDGQLCNTADDCKSKACNAGICSDSKCVDGTKNGRESDVDCGGFCSVKCAVGNMCAANDDCASKSCSAGVCVAATCSDVLHNGAETAVDCGGSCVASGGLGCANGLACHGGYDCISRVCTGGLCAAPTCTDGIKNGTEAAIDCGGSCSACAALPLGLTFESQGSQIQSITTFGNQLYFVATDGRTGTELWVSDGSLGGTRIVSDIGTGAADGVANPVDAAGKAARIDAAALDQTLLFAASDPTSGAELWRTNGSAGGTARVKDIEPGSAGSAPKLFVRHGGYVYFSATTAASGSELWRSDGTDAGTTLVIDLKPGASGSEPTGLVAYAGRLYFVADNGTSGRELWSTDGTAAGTTLLMDVNAGAGSGLSTQGAPLVVNARLVFVGGNAVTGPEPWSSDGTAAGTAPMGDFQPGAVGSAAQSTFTVSGGVAYFAATTAAAGTELWRTDGTAAGTMMVKDAVAGSAGSNPGHITAFRVGTASGAIFSAEDPAAGAELWFTDGTAGGTTRLLDIRPGAVGSQPRNFQVISSVGYFAADDGAKGVELWRTNGTVAGTSLVTDLNFGAASGMVDSQVVAALNGMLYFAGNNGVTGVELFRSNGTASGTKLVAEVNAVASRAPEFTEDTSVANGPVKVAMVATTSALGLELYATNGTAAGTAVVKDITPGPAGSNVSGLYYSQYSAQTIFFNADDGMTGNELWGTGAPGSGACTCQIEDLAPGVQADGTQNSSFPMNMGPPNVQPFYFSARDSTGVAQLWSTTGSTGKKLKGPNDILLKSPRGFVETSNPFRTVFAATTGDADTELWLANLFGGQTLVKDIRPGVQGSSLVLVGRLFNDVLMTADDGVHGVELWLTDGTEGGTRLFKDIDPTAGANSSSHPANFVKVGDNWFFSASTPATGVELWKTDGVTNSPVLVKDLRPGSLSSSPHGGVAVGATLFFVANDGANGAQLWKSDGTPLGTSIVTVLPGTPSISNLVAVGTKVYFAADDPAKGREVWRTDGTTMGTALVADLTPNGSTQADHLWSSKDLSLYFTGSTGEGRTLWRIPPTP